jgi:hypothetical protein
MKAPTLTTTLIELNRLYKVVDKRTPHSQEAESAWIEYEMYVQRYKEERGMEDAACHSCVAEIKNAV